MGAINFGIIGNFCQECSKAKELVDRVYVKERLNSILKDSFELVCNQHQEGLICDCPYTQLLKILEFLGNQCAFCDNKSQLIYEEILPYINKQNPLKMVEQKKVAPEKIKKEVLGKVVNIGILKDKK